ncbi:hypothetical protein [uncultured Olegusella sp.]|uniref:hypothetical protein n=1 Tax=uncultured Olegusella sp. TaxID=1979846 RepID=UPI002609C94C|nr:hypothetical protein [uncultured Olegusella sp.]
MVESLSQLAKARLASGLTIEDARKALKMSYPTYKQREDKPELFSFEEMRALSKEFNSDGKRIFKEWVDYFFTF